MSKRLLLSILLTLTVILNTAISPAKEPAADRDILSAKTLAGDAFQLKFTGLKKPVLLVFWASWCSSCNTEAPEVVHLQKEMAKDLDVIGITVDEDLEAAEEYVSKYKIKYPILQDGNLKIADRFKVKATPALLLIGTDGKVITREKGLNKKLIKAIEENILKNPESSGSVFSPEKTATASLIHKGNNNAVQRSTSLMGTSIDIVILTENEKKANEAIDAAIAEMSRIEEMMTDWKETSQLSAINHAAGLHPVKVDPELLELLEESKKVSELTDGRFDVTYKGAGYLWDFQSQHPEIPDREKIMEYISRIDYHKIDLDFKAGTAYLQEKGMQIGLGGIAKGYAVDRAMDVIGDAGFSDYAVNAGGDLSVRGLKNNKLWWVSIRHPREHDKTAAILPVSNLAVVTSGDYERFFMIDGQRYSHIIDPKTGWPARYCQSVTVMAKTAAWADALATGVFVLGPEKGLALIESLPDVEGVIIDGDGRMHISKNLKNS